ncbi:beta strand repeat-containing protein [Novosphingobium cyanobacteriorum]|uniref:Calcium-binding protein n=1 Tax=Novosphingobium cyanobacteriorum TaxID=3024215 RepID=A0ABT6CNG4_9SPHN|nr:hypothetical protein [Novosphingobium cyanobacteriorum]MDF8334788.1 hypothetical protein [Novosphingobium cyanobacteriorum]
MADPIKGDSLDNILKGTEGDDTLQGFAGADTLIGFGGADMLDGGTGADTMRGGAGDDTYKVDDAGDLALENADAGTDTVLASVSFVLGGGVENLTLTGSDGINGTGNTLANTITGNLAANVLDGGKGIDTLIGGRGDDVYHVDRALDVVVEALNEGYDTVVSTAASYVLADNLERLLLAGTGNIAGTGNALQNVIHGNSGNNTLNGGANGAKTGTDELYGGLGDDTYIINDTFAQVIEYANEGNDTVITNRNFALGNSFIPGGTEHIENLILTGETATNGIGNSLANTITGNAAANFLDGGIGSDTLIGGLGDDTYRMTYEADRIIEKAGEGIDTVQTSIDYTLSANVENIIAIGSSAVTLTGNALANRFSNIGTGKATMIGGDGDDTYDLANLFVPDATVIELRGQGVDTILVARNYILPDNVENLTMNGSSSVTLTGNGLANTLTGNAGDDLLDGLGGADTMVGGLGADFYRVDNVGDVVIETQGSDRDGVSSTISYTLPDRVEGLYLMGKARINATGNAAANEIYGNGASNIIDGKAGGDTMVGGGGNDTYYVDNAKDVIVEGAIFGGSGFDTVHVGFSYILPEDVEKLVLEGTAQRGKGNAKDNVLVGNAAANVLDGQQGTDTLTGGDGDDTYYVDLATDRIVEQADEGIDTVIAASVSYTLSANVENLQFAGVSGVTANGNALANKLTGTAGNDIIDGKAGVDTMVGGLGDDRYVVDDNSDRIIERAGEGFDTVSATVAYVLGANLENLQIAGRDAIDGTGNADANIITGNSAANVIDGRAGDDQLFGGAGADILIGGDGNDILTGGLGRDTMRGGLGDDTYVVDVTGEVLIESSGAGFDTVLASADTTLASNIEALVLVEGTSGAQALRGTGNALDNTITGNGADNVLDGGKGADTLIGGGGFDTFIVDNAGDTVAGNGKVLASVSFTLAGGPALLDLTGTANIDGTGSEGNDTINGNSAANTLSGLVGSDRLFGNAGRDTLLGGDGDDTLGGGTDNDTLDGGSGNDLLDGGTGADKMSGGEGTDRYIVDNVGDVVIEAGTALDLVYTTVDFTAAVGVEFISAILASEIGVTGDGLFTTNALVLTGNGSDNTIVGNDGDGTYDGKGGNDVIVGGRGDDTLLGGAGNDWLIALDGRNSVTGGEDADVFLLSLNADGTSGVTTVTDFTAGTDKVGIDTDRVFGAGFDGELSAQSKAFVLGTTAADADSRVIYDQATGKLYFDTDGTGEKAQVLTAQFAANTVLSADDFLLVSEMTTGAMLQPAFGLIFM